MLSSFLLLNFMPGKPASDPMPEPGLDESLLHFQRRLDYESFLEDHITGYNPDISKKERGELVRLILNESARLQIPSTMTIDGRKINPVHFLTALIEVESGFERFAVSVSDARGYLQIKPQTAEWIGQDKKLDSPQETYLFYTSVNLRLGVDYLNFLLESHPTVRLATLAYNAGPGAVKNGVFQERYWEKVLDAYRRLEKENGENPWVSAVAVDLRIDSTRPEGYYCY